MNGQHDRDVPALRATSSTARTWTQRDLASMRPDRASPRRRAPATRARQASQATRGVVCLCGRVFGEGDAVEFMLHLRAEVGADLRLLEKVRRWRRKTAQRPEVREKQNAYQRARRADPAVREEENRRQQERRAANRDEYRARSREQQRARAADPEWRRRKNMRQQAQRLAQGQPCACGCGDQTRGPGRQFRAGHHTRVRGPLKAPGTTGRPALALGVLRMESRPMSAGEIAQRAEPGSRTQVYTDVLRRLEARGLVTRAGTASCGPHRRQRTILWEVRGGGAALS